MLWSRTYRCDTVGDASCRARHGLWVPRASAISGGGVRTTLATDGFGSMATQTQVRVVSCTKVSRYTILLPDISIMQSISKDFAAEACLLSRQLHLSKRTD